MSLGFVATIGDPRRWAKTGHKSILLYRSLPHFDEAAVLLFYLHDGFIFLKLIVSCDYEKALKLVNIILSPGQHSYHISIHVVFSKFKQ